MTSSGAFTGKPSIGEDGPKPITIVLRILSIVAVMEAVTMLVVRIPGMPPGYWRIIIDVAVMAVLSAPLLYFWVVREVAQRLLSQQSLVEKSLEQELVQKAYADAIISSALSGLVVLSADLRVLSANPAAGRALGRSPEELQGLDLEKAVRADELRALATEVLATRQSRPDVVINCPDDGDGKVLRVGLTAVQVGNAELLLSIEDITERTKAEGVLRQRDREVTILLDSLPAYAFFKDAKCAYITANQQFCDALGCTQSEIVGKTDYEVFPRDLADKFRADDLLLVEGKEALFLGEEEMIDRGRTIPVMTRKIPLTDETGSLTGLIGLAFDISERKRMEEALRKSEDRFRRLAENAVDVILRFEVRPVIRVAYINSAVNKVFGYTPKDFFADPDLLLMLILPDDRDKLVTMIETGKVPKTEVLRWQHSDGRTIWTEDRLVSINDENGELVAIEGIIRDITERKQMEEELLRGQRLEAAGRIAGQVAHDFNNLLGPLLGYPELIKMTLPADHLAVKYCDAMLEVGPQMVEISGDLLTLSRRGHFDREPMDLNYLIKQTVEQMPRCAGSLVVDLDLAEDLLNVKGSSAQLLRVISNLLSNAREAMRDIGVLGVSTRNVYVDQPFGRYNRVEVGEYVRLEVRDTGCGISVEIKDKIFDAFFTTKTMGRRRGSGLGLSIVQTIVADHSGYVDVESEIGKGTIFSLYLPVCREELKEEEKEEYKGGSETILVVDDDEVQREVVKQLLQTLGYRVSVVSGGEEAVSYLREKTVDLLILDMIMPEGIDGAETYRRAQEVRPGVKAIILSGYAESEQVRRAQALGAGAYVRKPVTLEGLARAVRQGIDTAD